MKKQFFSMIQACLLILTIGFWQTGFSQVNISANNTDFNTNLNGWNGILPSGFTRAGANYVGTAASTTGGCYAISGAGFGYQPSGTAPATSCSLTATFQNTTGSTITSLQVSYDAFQIVSRASRTPNWTVTSSLGTVSGLNWTFSTAPPSTPDHISITLTGLNIANNSTFTFTFASDRGSGSGSSPLIGLNNITVKSIAGVCNAPTGLSATGITSTTADLSWGTVTGATGYQYIVDQTSTNPAGAGTSTTGTTYNATLLNPSTTYYLHVRTDCGSSSFSTWTTIPFTTIATPCDAPTGLTAINITDHTADLSWATQTGITDYEYVVDQTMTDPVSAGTITTDTSYAATLLNESTTYYLHVRTQCANGQFSPWTTIPFTTIATPCDAPTGLTAANITDHTADLSWATQTGITDYEYVVDQTMTDPVSAGTVTTDTSYAATLLNESTTYYLHVRTQCANGQFSPWATIPFTTIATPCDAPTGLTAANITDHTADLSWATQTGITDYEYVVDQTMTDPVSAGTVTTDTSYAATLLNESTTYYLHVRTQCANGQFSPWATIPFTTIATPCDAPTGLTAANITDHTADLSWATQTGITDYEYVVDQTMTDPVSAGTVTTDTSYAATLLNESTTYYLHVRTQCANGQFSPWATIPFTTIATPCDAPTGLTAINITDHTADLSWATQTGITDYEYVVDQTMTDPVSAGTVTTDTSYATTLLNESTTYYLHVRTQCANGQFSPWTTIPFTTIATPCDAPTGLTAANITDHTADLSWATQTGITDYEYVVDQTSANPSGAGTVTTGTTYSATLLNESTTYYLHVRTQCANGQFSPWATIPFTTIATPCDAPTGLTAANITDHTADLSWATQTGITDYEYVVDQTSANPSGAGTVTTGTTYSATLLNESTTYYLHVRTQCTNGQFSPWATIPFTTIATPCDAPTGLTAANITDHTADLSWATQTGITDYEYVVDQTSANPSGAGTVTTGTTYSATLLNESTTYYLHVRTQCTNGQFSPWATIPFTTIATPCDAPTGLTAINITDHTADLSWATQTGITDYEYVVDQTSANPSGAGTVTTGTTYSATLLNESTTYYLHVRTQCANGQFSPWATIPFTTLVTPCPSPTGLSASNIGGHTATISWTPSGISSEYVFDQNSANPAGSGTPTSAASYSSTSLNGSTTYYFHVRANCGNGNFSEWTTISFTTLSTVGIEEEISVNLFVSPNPTTNLVTISGETQGTIEVINLKGQHLMSVDLEKTSTLDVSRLESGLYFLMYTNKNKTALIKLIKQ